MKTAKEVINYYLVKNPGAIVGKTCRYVSPNRFFERDGQRFRLSGTEAHIGYSKRSNKITFGHK